ncbi:MAG TPA: hypothetical protein VIZ17_15930 [Acetobacteraceae bacterium]
MMNELIAKIAAQTGQPVETVTPIVGALLAHLGDVLPAPLAHQLAVMLGIHPDDGTSAANTQQDDGTSDPNAQPGATAGAGSFAGATSLMNVAQSLLGGYLAQRR